jgi:YVTN family beta-propeller protein
MRPERTPNHLVTVRLAALAVALLSIAAPALLLPGYTLAEPNAYVALHLSGTVAVLDTESNTVVDTVAAGNRPHTIAITPDGAFAYVTNVFGSNVSVIDTSTNGVVATIPVGAQPKNPTITPDGAFVYVVNYHSYTVSVIDTSSNTVISTIWVGHLPSGIDITPDGAHVYVTVAGLLNPYPMLKIIEVTSNTVLDTIILNPTPNNITITPDGAFAYMTHHEGFVSVLEIASGTVVDTIAVGALPVHAAITPDGAFAYVTNFSSHSVSVLDLSTNTVIATIPVGTYPLMSTFVWSRAEAYVTNTASHTISVIDTDSNTVVDTFSAGAYPHGIAIMPTPDTDGDGIHDSVDEEPFAPSSRFSDVPSGGLTSGRIVGLDAGVAIEIMDGPDPADGVRVLVSGASPDDRARLRIDGSKGTYKLAPGEYILTAGSLTLEVLAGRAEIEFLIGGSTLVIGVEGTVTVDEVIADGELQELVVHVVEGTVTVDDVVVPPGETLTTVAVSIDVKPGSEPNCFNDDGHGVIPVAVLSSADFDATQVGPTTVSLDGEAVRVVGRGKALAHIEDANGDGLDDLVVQIEDEDATYQEGDSLATLTGSTLGGTSIVGTDTICIVP